MDLVLNLAMASSITSESDTLPDVGEVPHQPERHGFPNVNLESLKLYIVLFKDHGLAMAAL